MVYHKPIRLIMLRKIGWAKFYKFKPLNDVLNYLSSTTLVAHFLDYPAHYH